MSGFRSIPATGGVRYGAVLDRARAFAGLAAMAIGGCTPYRPAVEMRPPARAVATPVAVPPGMQYLYGSAEAAALSEQAYTALTDHVRLFVESRKDHPGPRQSVVLAPGTTLARMDTVPCGDRPVAAVFDMDETAVLNVGYESGDTRSATGYDPAKWARYEATGAATVVAAPGAIRAFDALRAMGVTVIVNTNRNASSAQQTAAALADAGLGPFVHGETLFLKGDVDGKPGKDGRRAAIAARWCVAAMAGDQLGDFTDLFVGSPAARRAEATAVPASRFFGTWWFVLPNPVYGTGLGATYDAIFPQDRRWIDRPATGAK